MKLSKTQKDVYEELKSSMELALNSKDVREYYINDKLQHMDKDDVHYNEMFKHESEMYDKYEEMVVKTYTKYYEEAKKGIVLVQASSNTLKSLERKGLIKIIEDGKQYVDKVQLL